MGGITGVFGISGLINGDTSGNVELALEVPVSVPRGGTGSNTPAGARGSLFTFTPTNAVGDMYYRNATGTPGTLQRIVIGSAGQVLTVNPTTLVPQWMTPAGTGPGGGDVTNPMGSPLDAGGYNITGVGQLGATTIQITNGVQSGVISIDTSGELNWNSVPLSGGAGGGITSVFGRSTAAIVAELGDYTAAQVTNAVRTDMPGGYTDPAWLTLNWGGGRIAGIPSTFQPVPHQHAAADITSGIIDVARLGTGTPDNTQFLRGDGAWAIPPTGSGPGGGQDQTPWEQPINANNFPLTNVSRIGIGTATPVHELDVVGDINTTGRFLKDGVEIGTGGGMPNPWTEDVDADRWNLLHVGQVSTQYLTFCNDVDPSIDLQMLNGRMDVGGAINATEYYKNGVVFSPGGASSQWTDISGGIVYTGGKVGIGSFPEGPNTLLSTGDSIAPIKIALYDWGNPNTPCIGIGVQSTPNPPALTFGAGILPDGSGNPPQMVLTTDGHLGIGTQAPGAPLTVAFDADPQASGAVAVSIRGAWGGGLSLVDTLGGGAHADFFTTTQPEGIANLRIGVAGATQIVPEFITIGANNRLGLNNSTPQHTLDVNGDIHLTGLIYPFAISQGPLSPSEIGNNQISFYYNAGGPSINYNYRDASGQLYQGTLGTMSGIGG